MFVEEYLKDLRRAGYTPAATVRYVARCTRRSLDAARARPRALTSVVLAGFAHVVALLGIAFLLSYWVDRALAIDYLIHSVGWLFGGLLWVALHLGMFKEDKDLPLSGLGLPNFLTLGRVLAIPAFYLFITHSHERLALAAFLIGGLSDVADGVAARYLNASTKMGRIFDPVVDILFNAGVAWALTAAGYLPGWLLALVLTRYGLLLFGATWIYVVKGPVAVRPTVLGKTAGVFSSGLVLAVVVMVTAFSPEGSEQALELIYLGLGFVMLLTIVQVLVIGLYNLKHAGSVPAAGGAMGVVLGSRGVDEPAEDSSEHGS